MKINNALIEAIDILENNRIENARLDSEILLAHVLKVERIFIYVNAEFDLTIQQLATYRTLIKRRAAHEPVAYIIGHKEFMNFDFIVTPDVLIPRPETEILVEATVERLKFMSCDLNIADIGVGSGAICISLVRHLDNAYAHAVDISSAAIEVAKMNATIQNVLQRIKFYVGDLLTPLAYKKFNAIVSNPPYIPHDVISTLQPEVAEHEPKQALDGGSDGLNFYRRLIQYAPDLIVEGGFLAFEIGINQAVDITKLIKDSGHFGKIEIIKDLATIERVVIAYKI